MVMGRLGGGEPHIPLKAEHRQFLRRSAEERQRAQCGAAVDHLHHRPQHRQSPGGGGKGPQSGPAGEANLRLPPVQAAAQGLRCPLPQRAWIGKWRGRRVARLPGLSDLFCHRSLLARLQCFPPPPEFTNYLPLVTESALFSKNRPCYTFFKRQIRPLFVHCTRRSREKARGGEILGKKSEEKGADL